VRDKGQVRERGELKVNKQMRIIYTESYNNMYFYMLL
jgi:hypothetical protein